MVSHQSKYRSHHGKGQSREARRTNRDERRARAREQLQARSPQEQDLDRVEVKPDHKPFVPLTENQRLYMNMIRNRDLVFGIGTTGTGKTRVAVEAAVSAIKNGTHKRVIVGRPAVEAGEKLGFLPGELNEKIDPYFKPVEIMLRSKFGSSLYDLKMKRGEIEFVPLSFLRGRTFDDSFMLLDEAQNTTPEQMEMFLTRGGHNTKYVISGDFARQTDLPNHMVSGLKDAVELFTCSSQVGIVNFTPEDIVRGGICRHVLETYARAKPK